MSCRTIVALAVLLSCGNGFAAQNDPCSAASSTPDVRFALTVKDGRSVFQQGEIIPLVLSFSSTVKDRYWAEVRNYGRSGRLGIESYCVAPQALDPIAAYLGGFGGGAGNDAKITESPLTASAELNEWRSLAPGHYRVYAVSDRVWRPPDSDEKTPNTRVSEVLRSNDVELDVTEADPGWRSEQLRNAVQTLTGGASPDRRQAARTIRFLNTEESARQLARLFWGLNQQQPEGWDLMFGLVASPYRSLAIDSMLAEIAVPDHAITGDFLNTLVRLQFAVDGKVGTAVLLRAATDKVVAALPRKVGSARALTLAGLLTGSRPDPAMVRQIRPALIAAWTELPLDTQREFIQYEWPLIAGPDMLPILLRIVDEPPTPNRTVVATTREAALEHILELDPAAGRALILREAMDRNAYPTVDIVRLLPPDDLATVVSSAMERIRQNNARALDFELLDRYGDARVLDAAKRIFEENPSRWNCTPDLLRYLLRVDPEYGARQVGVSLGLRKENECYKRLLQSLGDELPAVEESAIKALDDPDPDLVADAILALRYGGSAGAEPALWKRLERIHREWSGREGQLRASGNYNSEGSRAFALEQSLTGAIAAAAGWFCAPEKLAQLADLAWSAAQKQQIKLWTQAWNQSPVPITLNWTPFGALSFSVLQYALPNEAQLAAKIAQFPAGTQLVWNFQDFGQAYPPITIGMEEAAYERLRDVAGEHGVTLESANHP